MYMRVVSLTLQGATPEFLDDVQGELLDLTREQPGFIASFFVESEDQHVESTRVFTDPESLLAATEATSEVASRLAADYGIENVVNFEGFVGAWTATTDPWER
jgi:hypothetical protein